MDFDEVVKKIRLTLGVFVLNDDNLDNQLEQYIKIALEVYNDFKQELLYSEQGILLITLFVNDMWKSGGVSKMSPATDMFYDRMVTINNAN